MTVIKHFKAKTGMLCSFRNESHLSFQSEWHKNQFADCADLISKRKLFQNDDQQNLFWNENTFKISFQKENHQSYSDHI